MKQFGEYLSEAKKSRTTIGAENIIEKGKIPPAKAAKNAKIEAATDVDDFDVISAEDDAIHYVNADSEGGYHFYFKGWDFYYSPKGDPQWSTYDDKEANSILAYLQKNKKIIKLIKS